MHRIISYGYEKMWKGNFVSGKVGCKILKHGDEGTPYFFDAATIYFAAHFVRLLFEGGVYFFGT